MRTKQEVKSIERKLRGYDAHQSQFAANDLKRYVVLLVSTRGSGRLHKQAGKNRIVLLPDCDDEGEAGFKTLLWKLVERRIDVRLGCSSTMFDGQFQGRQPEDFSDDDWETIDSHL